MKHMAPSRHASVTAALDEQHWSRCLATILAVLLAAVSCAKSYPSKPALVQTLSVFAAASLRDPFSLLGAQFRQDNPHVVVTFNFAGTQALRMQLEQGAQADVFASADQRHMNALATVRLVSSPTIFAHNEPVIVVTRERATLLESLADLPSLERIVVGVPEVPIGRYAIQILDRASALYGASFRARVEAKICSRELNVKQVLAKVAMGEAQAGIVYRSDVTAQSSKVTVVSIDPKVNIIAEYPIAVVSTSLKKELAQRFVAFVLSRDGQRQLSKAGFTIPLPVERKP